MGLPIPAFLNYPTTHLYTSPNNNYNLKVNVFEIGYGLLHINKESALEVSDFTIRNNALDAPQLQSNNAENMEISPNKKEAISKAIVGSHMNAIFMQYNTAIKIKFQKLLNEVENCIIYCTRNASIV